MRYLATIILATFLLFTSAETTAKPLIPGMAFTVTFETSKGVIGNETVIGNNVYQAIGQFYLIYPEGTQIVCVGRRGTCQPIQGVVK